MHNSIYLFKEISPLQSNRFIWWRESFDILFTQNCVLRWKFIYGYWGWVSGKVFNFEEWGNRLQVFFEHFLKHLSCYFFIFFQAKNFKCLWSGNESSFNAKSFLSNFLPSKINELFTCSFMSFLNQEFFYFTQPLHHCQRTHH